KRYSDHSISVAGDPLMRMLFCWALQDRLASSCFTSLRLRLFADCHAEYTWRMGLGQIPQSADGVVHWDETRWGTQDSPVGGWYLWGEEEKAGYQAVAAESA